MTTREPFDFLTPSARNRSGDDLIFKLNAEARARAKTDKNVVNATLGALLDDSGALMTLPVVAEAFAAIDPQRSAGYAPILGEPQYLRGVVRDLFVESELANWSVAAATPGGSGALCLAVQTFTHPGEAVLVPDLYWGPYKTMTEQNGRRLESWPLFTEKGGLDLFAFEKALDSKVRADGRALVFLNFPCNNPTGYSPTSAEWRSLSEIVRGASKHGAVTILIDHAYARFAEGGGDEWVIPMWNILPDALLLVAWTASKSFAQYGARVGSLVAVHPDPALRERVSNAFGFGCRGTWSNCNHLGQLAIGILLSDETLQQRVRKERSALVELLGKRVSTFNTFAQEHGLKYPRYEGGFFVSVFCDDATLAADRARELGVYVVPQRGSLRVALCGTPEHAIPRLVQTIAKSIA